MVKVSEDSAAKFINALIKSVQTLCHGYLEFSNGIQIIGHINLSVDEGTSLDYILKEKVCKNAENSTLFISNSFHAEPKSEPEVSGKNPVNQRTPENQEESGRVGSAISSISSALTSSREKRKTGTKDSDNLHSHQNSGKRKASDDADHRPPKVTSHHDNSSASQSPYHSQSSPLETKEALRSKLRTASEMDMAESETLLPQTAGISGDSAADIGVNLAGSVLEPVDDQGGDLPGRDDDSDGDLEVTFIKEEFVEGERSACEYGNTGPFIGSHQRASEGMTDPSLYPVSLHSSSTYVPSAHDFQPGPSTSQSGSSSMRDFPCANSQMNEIKNEIKFHRPDQNKMSIKLQLQRQTFKCSICYRVLSRMDSFKRHMRCHTGQLFECVICGLKYNSKYMLHLHQKSKHKDIFS